jgi:nucleoside-diphosphate-sugar epimerase
MNSNSTPDWLKLLESPLSERFKMNAIGRQKTIKNFFKHFTTAMALRMSADAVMVATCWLTAYMLTFLWQTAFGELERGRKAELYRYLDFYFGSVGIVLLVHLAIFHLSGFYTRGRAYASKYKALVILQAISISYLVVALVMFLMPGRLSVPRSVLPIAWILCMCTLATARLWSSVWKALHKREISEERSRPNNKIQSILVIGGAGYIGSALLPKLLDRGYQVRLLDLFLFGKDPIGRVIDHPNLEIVEGDFRQINKIVECVQGMDAVIHLGGIVGDPACALDEDLTIEVNLMATRFIAEVAKGHRTRRFIFASTCSVYGANDILLDENSSLNPVSLYASSKIASERVLLQMASDTFAPVILRFGTIYGLSGRTRFDLVVNLLAAKAMMEGKITLSGGDQWRPFVHVDDAALAVVKSLEAAAPLVEKQIFNVGSDEQNFTLQQVGELIKRLVPTSELVEMGCDSDRRNYRVSFKKIRDILGFQPEWTVEKGVQQVIDAIKTGKVKDYKSAKYSNVKFLTEDKFSQLIRTTGWERKLIKESAPALVS